MSIAAITVNYGTADLVLAHADAVRAELARVPGSRWVIVDNASPNGDAARLQAGFAGADDVTVIAAPRNGGFSYGNNRGIEAAGDRFEAYYLLNPDAYPLEGCLEALLSFLRDHPKAGLVGSRLEGADGTVQRSAFRFPSPLSEFEGAAATGPISRLLAGSLVAPPPRNEAHRTDWLCGGSLMIRAEALADAGPMDEDYFLYFEEVDFHRAALRAGWEAWYVPQARAVHLVGQSTGMKDSRTKGGVPDYWYDSRSLYLRKNHGAGFAAVADLARVAGGAVSALRGLAKGRRPDALRADTASLNAARRRAGAS